jgi:hypothetical protein
MEEKNRIALERPGVRKILADFINLFHPEAHLSLTEFRERYGPLLISSEDKDPIQPVVDKMVLRYARDFATALDAEMKTERQSEAINKTLDEILGHATYATFLIQAGMSETVLSIPSAIRADFLSGAWEPTSRTLLDALAIELMRSRKLLRRCERPECRLYFVKTFSRDRYCSNLCSEEMRRRGQDQWVSEHRQEINRRRRNLYSKASRTRKRS